MLRNFLIAAFWLLAGSSQAQSLGDALEQAWARYPQARVFNAQAAEANARLELASGYTPAPPTVSLSNVNDRLNASTGKDAWELELAIPIWQPGQRAARGREAQSLQSEVAARRDSLRLQLAAEVRDAWWAVAGARNVQDLAMRREAAASALRTDAQRRLKAGEIARVEANLVDLEYLAAQSEVLEAQSTIRQAEQAYFELTGTRAPEVLLEEAPLAGAMDAALHPQLIIAQAQYTLAQSRVGSAQLAGREAPELALRWVRDRGDAATPYADSVGIKLTVPFGSPARQRQESAAALAEASQAEAELARAQQRIAQNVARAQQDLLIAELQISKAQERLALTHDTLQLSEKSYTLGESDLSTLLRARSAAFDAQAFLMRQRTARAASISRLNQSLGVMP